MSPPRVRAGCGWPAWRPSDGLCSVAVVSGEGDQPGRAGGEGEGRRKAEQTAPRRPRDIQYLHCPSATGHSDRWRANDLNAHRTPRIHESRRRPGPSSYTSISLFSISTKPPPHRQDFRGILPIACDGPATGPRSDLLCLVLAKAADKRRGRANQKPPTARGSGENPRDKREAPRPRSREQLVGKWTYWAAPIYPRNGLITWCRLCAAGSPYSGPRIWTVPTLVVYSLIMSRRSL